MSAAEQDHDGAVSPEDGLGHEHGQEPGDHRVTLREALRVWMLVGLQSFGGPAGQPVSVFLVRTMSVAA